MKETRTIFFIGKPGCGKGTQAKLLSERTGWPLFASGDEFRKIAQEDTSIGKKVKEEMESGLLAPPWFAMYLYLKALFSLPEQMGVIFDGFNRKVPEAELVIDSLRWLNRPFSILDIHISDEEARRRLAIRKGVEGRADDDAIDERLKEYYAYTEAAMDVFRKSGMLIEINGEQQREPIAFDIRTALGIK